MREILFRGKAACGAWVQGDLINRKIWYSEFKVIRAEDSGFDNYIEYEVITETIGQYTGLTDKNGKKIFEGDIVEFDGELCYAVYYIIFVDGCFRIAQNGKYSYTLHNLYSSLEVIGNIHDHPELLKGGEE